MNKGYTFIEASLVLAVLAILMTVSTISLVGVQRQAFVSQSVEILLSDIKQQQMKAINGQSESGGTDEYGVYFGTDSYTLFRGSVFDPADTGNFSVFLEGTLTFSSVEFAGNSLIFEAGSGEVKNFIAGSDTVVISDGNGVEAATIAVNELGVFTAIDQ